MKMLFAFTEFPDTPSGFAVIVVEEKHWKKSHCLDDSGMAIDEIDRLCEATGFHVAELMESYLEVCNLGKEKKPIRIGGEEIPDFEFLPITKEEAMAGMQKAGYEYSEELQAFLDSNPEGGGKDE
jgi:hypothetical protein